MDSIDSLEHTAWLTHEGWRLLAFAMASQVPEGFANLDARSHEYVRRNPCPFADLNPSLRERYGFLFIGL